MPPEANIATDLVRLAAEAIVPVIPGCSAAVSRDSRPGSRRAIDHFGPAIAARWWAGLVCRADLDSLAQLAGLTPAACRQHASEVLLRLAATVPEADQVMAVEYLSALPLTIRRSLIIDPATGQKAVPSTLWSEHEQALIQLLPADVPPFPVDRDLAGTAYRLEELVGMGGFGAVYRARSRFEQNQPPRAIKFCLESAMVATLQREQAMLDRLMAVSGSTWSNRVVRLYGYALDFDPPFLVYEFVPGGDLTSHLIATRQRTGRGFSPALAFQLVRQIAEALAFAHRHGLVHRDLKPANVLVNGSTIKLTDFGIGGVAATHAVRGSALSTSITYAAARDQARLLRGSGTPLYMSPEQRRGDQPDPCHDLYSLGVLWYQLLVGDVARELHPGWPDELIEEFQTPGEHLELIRRCVGYFKKRPPHAGELLALMRASPPSPPPGATPAPAVPPSISDNGHDGRQLEQLKRMLAEQIHQDAFQEARESVAAILRLRPSDPEAAEANGFLKQRLFPGLALAHCFDGHLGWVRAVAVAPDARLALSGGDDGIVHVWDLAGRTEVGSLEGHAAAVMSVAFSHDGRLALSAGWDGTVRVWELATSRERQSFGGAWKAVKCLALAPNGELVALGCDDNLIHLLDLSSGQEVGRLEGHGDLVQGLVFTPDGHGLVSASEDGTARIWATGEGREIRCLAGHQDAVTGVAISPDGRHILTGSSDTTARLWTIDGALVQRLEGHAGWVNAVTLAAQGRYLITASGGAVSDGQFLDGEDASIRVWDWAGDELACLSGHSAAVTCVAAAPGAQILVSGGLDRTVRIWGPASVQASNS